MTTETRPFVQEWRAYLIRCEPRFEEMFDEAEFFERLQDIGGWYLPSGAEDSAIVCVDLDGADERRDQALVELRRQGIEPAVLAEGVGFAMREEGGLLKSYRIEIRGDVYTGPSEPEAWRTVKQRWRALRDRSSR
jgi:hypothetical protein